jgi:hypothetical protein
MVLSARSPPPVNTNTDKPNYEEENEKNSAKSATGHFIGGTIDVILDRVIVGALDPPIFMRSFPMFLDPLDLMMRLQARFLHPKDNIYLEYVVDLLEAWYNEFTSDFATPELEKAFETFHSNAKSIEKTLPLGLFGRIDSISNEKSRGGLEKSFTADDPWLPLIFGPGKFDLYDISPLELVRQITLTAADYWRKINMRELLVWNTKSYQVTAPNVFAMVNHYNALVNIFSTFIISGCSAEQRGYYLRHLVDILEIAVDIRNFHLAFAIMGAFELAPITRLKKSWAILDEPREKILADLRVAFAPDSNYAKYREIISNASPPILPQVGVIVKDVTFIDDGNRTRFEGTTLVNWNKCVYMEKVLSQVHQASEIRFPFVAVPELQQYLIDYKTLNSNDLWGLSLVLEPRDATKPAE